MTKTKKHIQMQVVNIFLTAIKEDHTIDATVYTLPVCNSEVADYFSVNGGNLPAFDLDAVAALLLSLIHI